MAKQTAVQWLMANLKHTLDSKTAVNSIATLDIDDLNYFEPLALEMEQKQMQEMYLKGIENYDPTFKRKSQWTAVDNSTKLVK